MHTLAVHPELSDGGNLIHTQDMTKKRFTLIDQCKYTHK